MRMRLIDHLFFIHLSFIFYTEGRAIKPYCEKKFFLTKNVFTWFIYFINSYDDFLNVLN